MAFTTNTAGALIGKSTRKPTIKKRRSLMPGTRSGRRKPAKTSMTRKGKKKSGRRK
jgi:hypothetical protein